MDHMLRKLIVAAALAAMRIGGILVSHRTRKLCLRVR